MSSESLNDATLKPQERLDKTQKEVQEEPSWSAREKTNSVSSQSSGKESLDIGISYLRAGEKETSAAIRNSVPRIHIPMEESDSPSKAEGTFSIRKVEIVNPDSGTTSPKKTVPPPVMPRRRGGSSGELSLNVDIAQKEATEQQSKEQESEGSVDVKAYPVMVRPSASPRTSITSPKGPPPPVMPRTRPRSQTSDGDSPRNLSFESCSPLHSPRTPDTKDVLESNRKPSSVAKQFGTVKSPMSRKMSGLIDKFQHEEVSPVSPESDKVFSPRMSFEDTNSGNELRKHFSFSVSEEPKPQTKAEMSPKSPPKVAPKPKRKSGEIKYNPSEPQTPSSTETGSKEQTGEKTIGTEKKSPLLTSTSNEKKHDKTLNSGLKLASRPHSGETVFSTRSLVSTSSLTRLKGLQIPSKPVEAADVSQPSSTLQGNPSKLAPALRPRSGPAAFSRVQPKIHQVSPKLNLMPIKLKTDSTDDTVNKSVGKAERAISPHSIEFQDKPSNSLKILNEDVLNASKNDMNHQKVETVARLSAQSETGINSIGKKEEKHVDDVKEESLAIGVKPADERKNRPEDDERESEISFHSAVSPEANIVNNSQVLKDRGHESIDMNVSLNDSFDVRRIETSDSIIVSKSDESKRIDSDNKEQIVSFSEHSEIPVLERFAETVSSDVIGSSLMTASSLLSTDGQTSEPNEPDIASVDSAAIENKSEGEVVEANLIANDGPECEVQNSSATISVEVDVSNTESPFEVKTDSLLDTVPTDAPSCSNDSSSEQDSNIPLKQTEDGNSISLIEGSQSPVSVSPSDSKNVVIESGNLMLNSKADTAIRDVAPQAGLRLSSSKSGDIPENLGHTGEVINGSVMDPAAEEPLTQKRSSKTNDEDSDVPPSLPSSAPPPLPSSPPPDLVTGLGSPSLHAEQSIKSSLEPRPPLALRRHQDAEHVTSSQTADLPDLKNTPASPSHISLSIDPISKEEPLETDDSVEFQDEELVASTPCEDNKGLLDTTQPLFSEIDSSTMQSFETQVADDDRLSKIQDTTVCVPGDASTNQVRDKNGCDPENTEKTVSTDVSVSPEIVDAQIDQNNHHVVETSQTPVTATTLSSDMSSVPPAEQNTGRIRPRSGTDAPVNSESPNTSIDKKTKESNGHVDQTRQTVSPTVTASPDISEDPVPNQSNGHVAQISQPSSSTAVTSNRRKVTLITKRPEESGAPAGSDKPFLPPDELTSLLNKANEALEKTGALDDEIIIVVLHKDIGQKVGLSFKNGPKNEMLVSQTNSIQYTR